MMEKELATLKKLRNASADYLGAIVGSGNVDPNGDTVQVNGITWDESDDVGEDEAQAFLWTLTGSTLIHEHLGTFTNVPKVYTITSLTSSSLCYEDDYGTKHQFSKAD